MTKLIEFINSQRIKIVTVYAIAQVLNIYSILIIGKKYSSDQYGIYVLISSLTGIIITLSNGKYHNNIISSDNQIKKKQLIFLSIIITITINLIFLIALFLLPLLFPNYKDINESLFHIPISFWVAAYCLFAGLNILTDAVMNDKEFYLKMSFGRLVKAICYLIGILLLNNLGWKGLLLSILLAQFIQFIFNGVHLYNAIEGHTPIRKELLTAAFEFKSSPKYNILLSLLIASTDYVVYSIIRYFWGLNFLGKFSLAEKIIKLPVALIGQPLAEQFFKKNADYYNSSKTEELKKSCLQYLKLGFLLLIVPILIALLFSKSIIDNFFPLEWNDLGWIVSILSPVMLFYFLVASWRSLSIILNIQKQHFWIELICFVFICLAILLTGICKLNEIELVFIKMVTEIMASISLLYWLYVKITIPYAK